MVRAFIAVELPEEVKNGLAGLRGELGRVGQGVVRWVSPESMHLTLKFLGETAEEMVLQVISALEEAVRDLSPFSVEAGELGFFPNASRPRVFWVGLEGDVAGLSRMQENVELATEALGLPRESRPFSPHLTLARFNDAAPAEERRRFSEKAAAIKLTSRWRVPVEGLSLMKSTLTRGGAIYARLAHLSLKA